MQQWADLKSSKIASSFFKWVCKWIAAPCVSSHWILSISKNCVDRDYHIWIPKFISLIMITTCAVNIQKFICDQFLKKDLKIPNPTVADTWENRKEMGHVYEHNNAVPKNHLLPGKAFLWSYVLQVFMLFSSFQAICTYIILQQG